LDQDENLFNRIPKKVEIKDSIFANSIYQIKRYIFLSGILCILGFSPLWGQNECNQDTVAPFCYVTSYIIQGENDYATIFFPEIAADLCSDISSSTFYHVEYGRIMQPGDSLPCGEHIFQNFVSDENANFTSCRFKVVVHCGEYTPPVFEPIAHRVQPAEIIHYPLGSLSAKWESGHLGSSAISCGLGDPGGVSYGLFQLSSTKGTLQDYLYNEGKEYLPILREHVPGTKEFNQNWKLLAELDRPTFDKSQYDYIYRTHYRRFCRKIENHFLLDINEFSSVVKDVFWSTAVQHGPSNNVMENTFTKEEIFVLTEEEIIDRIYNERLRKINGKLAYFPGVSRQIQKSLIRRYHAEKQMALNRLFNMEVAASRE
jgi:hypothetical protein